MAMQLTDRLVAGMKPAATQVDFWDAKVTGLGIRVAPSGDKSWSLRYRVNGRQRRLKIGVFPRITYAAACKLANRELRKVDGGVDPQAERRAARAAAEAERQAAKLAERDSIERLCAQYIERHAKPRKRSWRDDQSKINCEILPSWKGRTVTSITRRDCRALVQEIADRDAAIYANRIAALLSRIFRFAVDEELITANPAAHLPKPGVEAQARPDGERESKPYTDDEIRALWNATENLAPPARAIYRLGLITGQRPGEISNLEWTEITGDWWTIPGRRTKNGREHRVYLSSLAVEALRDVPRTDKAHAFAGWRGKRQLAEVNAVVFSVVRARKRPRHALRDTTATGLAACGVVTEDISKVINHSYGPRVTAGYNAYGYDKEKRLALNRWARRITAILEEKADDKVQPFARGGVA